MYTMPKKQRMLNKLATFDMTPTVIKRSTDLSLPDKCVYSTIYSTLMEGRPFFKGNKYLADQNNLSKYTIQKSLRNLKNKGYIKIGYQTKTSNNGNKYITKRVITGLDSSKLFSSKDKYQRALKKVNNNLSKSHKASLNTNKSHSTQVTASHSTYNVFNHLAPTQQNTIMSDAKLAHKLFDYPIRAAKSGIINQIIKYQNSDPIKLNDISMTLIITAYDYYCTNQSVKQPVAFACSITQNGHNDTINQFKKDKPIFDAQEPKIKEHRIDNYLKQMDKIFTVDNNKIIVDYSIDQLKFKDTCDELKRKKKYPNKLVDDAYNKFEKKVNPYGGPVF